MRRASLEVCGGCGKNGLVARMRLRQNGSNSVMLFQSDDLNARNAVLVT